MCGVAAADELITTEAENAALERLRAGTGGFDGPMERHCVRCRRIAARIAADRGWVLDGEVLTVAALLHDVGLYPPYATGGVYTADGAALARTLLDELGWSAQRIMLCAEAIDRHHELRSQINLGPEVEALRRADQVDVSGGLIRHRIPRPWLRSLFAEVPRAGLAGELRREVGRALRERPLTVPRIFIR